MSEWQRASTSEVVGRLNQDWAADIKAYDDGHDHMVMFADVLTMGIVEQFPDKSVARWSARHTPASTVTKRRQLDHPTGHDL